MGLYNVVAPCVVGNLHYVRPTTAPIHVDDAVAAPLVATGKLASISVSAAGTSGQPTEYAHPGALGELLDAESVQEPAAEPEKPSARPRRPRRGSED